MRLGDAADKQARAERLAYMRGEPVPSETEIRSKLLAWVRSGDCKRGGADTLPSLTTAEEAKMPKTINEGLVALATLMGRANPSHSGQPIPSRRGWRVWTVHGARHFSLHANCSMKNRSG